MVEGEKVCELDKRGRERKTEKEGKQRQREIQSDMDTEREGRVQKQGSKKGRAIETFGLSSKRSDQLDALYI